MAFAKVAKNFLSISLLQAINYLLPIIILPYLVKVVGVANFGISNYILTLFITIKILIDYR
jgi:PST family polysaccharide transporter